jgi:uncharacterized protein YdeI (YjbR/CyaY-like superfamily)
MPANPADYPIQLFADQAAWAAWLQQHHATEPGIWLRLAKAASELQSINRAEALHVALRYGWIDGQAKKLDDDSWLQKFTPRGKRSVWSRRNVDLVERLIAAGEMHPAGMAAVEAAKRDGRWDRAYDSPGSATVPPDLQAALDQNPDAQAFFETLSSRNRFAILYRIQTAIRPETRTRRIAGFVRKLQSRETLYP